MEARISRQRGTVAVVDCYTDEPAGLGVPPYLGTHPRYVAGAASVNGHQPVYLTIDDLRVAAGGRGRGYERQKRTLNTTPNLARTSRVLEQARLVVVITGTGTPGKYVSAEPGSPGEAAKLVERCAPRHGPLVAAGPCAYTTPGPWAERYDLVAAGDAECFVADLLAGEDPSDRRRDNHELDAYARAGACILPQHPWGAESTVELETSRGCPRALSGGCSFCIEPETWGLPSFRSAKDVQAEVAALAAEGARHFRLGRQSCIYSHGARGIGDTERPRPDPTAVGRLLRAVRTAAPDLATLHVDNANPAVIAAHPEEAASVTKLLVRYCTSGNIAALGMESADPAVVKANNLNAGPEEVLAACRLINRYGSERGENGLPRFLPGINVVFGLLGETSETYELDLAFLRGLLDEGLLVRRINLRVVVPYSGTRLARKGARLVRRHHSLIMTYRKRIRDEVDTPMLRRVLPLGTVLTGLRVEIAKGGTTFLRQPGTYPITAAIQAPLKRGEVVDATVVAHRQRSVTVVPRPLDVNAVSMSLLTSVPGIGKRWAARIVRGRPYRDVTELSPLLEEMSDPDALAAALGLPARREKA